MDSEQTLTTAPETTVPDDLNDEVALRWRRAILRLSETFLDAAGERSDLSPFLLEAMHNALNNLLVYGEAGDLMALEEWLSMEDEFNDRRAGASTRVHVARSGDRRHLERRAVRQPVANERRADERRDLRDWQFEPVLHAPHE